MITIRHFEPDDWAGVWAIIEPVFRAGETYAYPSDISEASARAQWVEAPAATFVAVEGSKVLGSYYLKANQPGPGAHVCNCGYIVAGSARGRGIAGQLCEHSQRQARERGFRAMQYNLVVATNEGAIRLWKRHGFDEVGRLPGAFRHPRHGFVDALVMYKALGEPGG
ncbi:GNAT family N-acetyltransferase [Modicisalibacter radicis]|uniref:GNAT family N-acetyltransferase n=1 Tax=Halomonas sp. EAR18 TaxID=2518972 RepID=UPI00109C76DA|nr:N-acetyltransferase [Halomonas sp. EAR18]